MRHDEQKDCREEQVLESFVALAHSSLGQLTPEQCLRGEREIRKRMAHSTRALRITGRKLLLAAAIVPGVIGTSLVVRQVARPKPLAFSVENGYLSSSQSVSGSGTTTPVVHFTDGTELRLAQDALARIRYVTPNGAGLAIERGHLHAQVVHSPKSEWQFDAGPFTVRVTGTSFGLTWEPELSRLDLRLEQGSVTVSGPVANEPIPIRSGQWLTIQTRTNEVLIRDLAASSATQTAAPVQSVTSAATTDSNDADSGSPLSVPAADESRGHAVAAEASHHWVAELARGHLDAIVKDAQSRGLEECLSKANSDELSALADAARYTRNNGIARRALMAIRQRFAGSRKAAEAAFLLGKLAEAAKSEPAALAFFDRYLSEAPNGTYASEALGRKMAIVRNTSGSVTARPLARYYLVKYPHGTYAPAAQAILYNP